MSEEHLPGNGVCCTTCVSSAVATFEAEKTELAQKVSDAEWLADEFYTVQSLNLADATEPEDVIYQVYNCQSLLIGDALVPTYWGAIRAAREAGG